MYHTYKLAAYMGRRVAVTGTDGEASRHQTMGLRAAAGAPAHQKTLRRLLSLRLWSGIKVGTFRVSTAENLADTLSRLKSFPSPAAAKLHAEECRLWWSRGPNQ